MTLVTLLDHTSPLFSLGLHLRLNNLRTRAPRRATPHHQEKLTTPSKLQHRCNRGCLCSPIYKRLCPLSDREARFVDLLHLALTRSSIIIFPQDSNDALTNVIPGGGNSESPTAHLEAEKLVLFLDDLAKVRPYIASWWY